MSPVLYYPLQKDKSTYHILWPQHNKVRNNMTGIDTLKFPSGTRCLEICIIKGAWHLRTLCRPTLPRYPAPGRSSPQRSKHQFARVKLEASWWQALLWCWLWGCPFHLKWACQEWGCQEEPSHKLASGSGHNMGPCKEAEGNFRVLDVLSDKF